ncbi:hypothetical protein BN2475_720009 [Paraburkholderia ribeironis]|uniref:Uncharacterized protein n=1 Tax=Paraburkholderia ribeironis TaxID=1247936 RepID=A0A1N7SIM2_9BURK|nr:hypothetical protein BN2475_720009 [Paraburkholderia ribeironis]
MFDLLVKRRWVTAIGADMMRPAREVSLIHVAAVWCISSGGSRRIVLGPMAAHEDYRLLMPFIGDYSS